MDLQGLIVSLIFIAFFAGIEIAFVTSNKLTIELQKKQGGLSSRILSRFIKSPSLFLGTTMVAINIALVIFSTLMSDWLDPYLRSGLPHRFNTYLTRVIIQTLATTFIVLMAGEFLPKAVVVSRSNAVLNAIALPFMAVYYLLYPIISIVVWVSRVILKYIFKIEIEEGSRVFTKVDLEQFIRQTSPSEASDNPIETTIFENALNLNDVKMRDCMVPRTEIEAVDMTDGLDALKNTFIKTRLSRIVIYQEDIDHIKGYIHHNDLFKNPTNLTATIRPMPAVPESMAARDMLNLMRRDRINMAWVVDEFGGTAGIVTMEDILEEIFGEIKDEHDVDDLVEKKINDNEYIFAGRLEVDYINDKYALQLPTGDYKTLTGLILFMHENIPALRTLIHSDKYDFEILSVNGKMIDTVRVKRTEG